MPPTSKKTSDWILEVLHILVGSVFLASGIIKGAYLSGFVFLLHRFEIFPSWVAWPIAIVLSLSELILGSMLVSGFHRKLARSITASLLVGFIFFLLIGMIGGWAHECSCYGTAVLMPPQWTVIQDGVLVLILTMLDRFDRPAWPHAKLRFALVLGAAGLIVAMSIRSPILDRYLVRLRPGLDMPNLPSVAVEAGNHGKKRIAVFIENTPEHEELATIRKLFPDHELVLITTREMPRTPDQATFVPGKKEILPFFYHHLPTAFIVEDSVVKQVWYGTLPSTKPQSD